MKVMETIEVTKCDFCGESSWDSCLGCGKDICYDCYGEKRDKAVRYFHGCHVQGSGDGIYCKECDQKMADDPLHAAYVQIKNLRDESERFYKDWDKRRKAAEAECARHYRLRKSRSCKGE